MGNTVSEKVEAASSETKTETETPKKLKACCACPETKKARDSCVIERGEDKCGDLIEAHKICMRKAGFNI